MTDRVRAFIAIELPREVTATLGELIAELQAAGIGGLRPVDPLGIHLTLKFLGDVPASKVDAIAISVAAVVKDEPPFALRLGRPGVFPGPGRPRVLWVGVEDEGGSLAGIQQRLEGQLEKLGLPREERPYSPHLTVARLRDVAPPAERRRAAEVLGGAGAAATGLRFDVAALSVMRSVLSSTGAAYRRLALAPLGGGTADGTDARALLPPGHG